MWNASQSDSEVDPTDPTDYFSPLLCGGNFVYKYPDANVSVIGHYLRVDGIQMNVYLG